MANFLMPTGQVRNNETSVSDGALVTGDTAVTDAVLERVIDLGRGAVGDIAAGPGAVAVVAPGGDTLTLLDPATLEVCAEASFDGEPTGVVVSDDLAFVSVASINQDAVVVLDLETSAVVATFPVASEITAMAVGPDGKRLYAGRAIDDRVEVTVIDVTAERAGTIDIGRGPAANIDALTLDPRGRRLFVAITDDDGSHLLSVDTETTQVRRVMPVGSPLRDVACAGDTVYALTSDRAVGGAVHVIDLATAKVAATIVVGGAPTQLSLSRDEARVYVVDYDRVHVVDTMRLQLVDGLAVSARPSCVAHSADGSRVFVADYSGAVHVFSVESTIGMLYAHLLATDSLALDVPRRQAITV